MRHLILAIAASLCIFTGAMAHDAAAGPHGGPVVDASGHHVEFTSGGDQVTFYLTDESEKPIASAGAKGSAIVQQGGKTSTVTLQPTTPNILTGHTAASIAGGARIVVSAKLSDGDAIQARFVKK